MEISAILAEYIDDDKIRRAKGLRESWIDLYILKKIACFLFVACATAMLYGNFPAKQIMGCEEQGVAEPVCMAAAWDSEKVDLLPAWNPDVQKLITAQKTLSAAEPGSFKS